MLYFPCIADSSGRIRRIVKNVKMTKEQAENYLKANYRGAWLRCEAIPQPCTVQSLYFRG